jgi:hypothetical protein
MPDSITTVAVTLSTATPDVILNGTIDAYGAAGVYDGYTFSAAVFGPADGTFHVHNRGDIESVGSMNTDVGILLGAPGHVVNAGNILAATGIAVFGTAGGGEIFNDGKIHATLGIGAYLQGVGTAENSGNLKGTEFGVLMAGGGYALNTGTVSGAAGIVLGGGAGSYVYNTGFVKATKRDGISLAAVGYVNNTGVIKAEHAGVVMAGGGEAYNYGKIQAGKVGVYLAGGSVLNESGEITAGIYGVELSAAGFVYNAGVIIGGGNHTGTLGAAVELQSGGDVYNTSKGRLTGLSGVVAAGGALTLINEGVIYASGSPNDTMAAGIYAMAGGTVFNAGTIAGASGFEPSVGGIVIEGAAGKVTNAGVMSGYFNFDAIVLGDGGKVVNTGTIIDHGLSVGIYLQNGGSVNNSGYIDAFEAVAVDGGAKVTNTGLVRGGVYLGGGSVLDNLGTIVATSAVEVAGGGTVVDSGTIDGAEYGVYFQPSAANELILKPGAEIYGFVYGGGGLLDLARATVAGSIDFNGRFDGFANLEVDRNAEWEFASGSSVAGTIAVDNDGTILALGGGGLTIGGPLFGKGTVDSGMGNLTLDGRVGKNESVILGAPGETLSLGAASAFAGKIEGFAKGDAIDLTGVAASLVTGISFSDGVLTVSESAASYTFTFANPGSFAHERFYFFRDHGDAGITLAARGQMSFLAPPAATEDAAAVQVPAVSYAPRAAAVVPSSTGHAGWMDSVVQHNFAALAPVVTLQG